MSASVGGPGCVTKSPSSLPPDSKCLLPVRAPVRPGSAEALLRVMLFPARRLTSEAPVTCSVAGRRDGKEEDTVMLSPDLF